MPWYRANREIPVKGHISFRRPAAGRHAGCHRGSARNWPGHVIGAPPAGRLLGARPLVANDDARISGRYFQTAYQQNGSFRHQYPLTWPARGSPEFW
jgi:hypothetical protein